MARNGARFDPDDELTYRRVRYLEESAAVRAVESAVSIAAHFELSLHMAAYCAKSFGGQMTDTRCAMCAGFPVRSFFAF